MMDVNNETIKRLAFLEVLELVAAGNEAALEQVGLSKEAITRIRNAGAKDVPLLSRMLNLMVSIDPRNLNINFARAEMAQEEQRTLEYFVANHATPTMMRRFFRTFSERDIYQLRTRLGAKRMGRTPTLDHKTAMNVYDAWERLVKSVPDERQRYMALHLDFSEWPLSSLYSAINETDGSNK